RHGSARGPAQMGELVAQLVPAAERFRSGQSPDDTLAPPARQPMTRVVGLQCGVVTLDEAVRLSGAAGFRVAFVDGHVLLLIRVGVSSPRRVRAPRCRGAPGG